MFHRHDLFTGVLTLRRFFDEISLLSVPEQGVTEITGLSRRKSYDQLGS
jgi:hypothetical protein